MAEKTPKDSGASLQAMHDFSESKEFQIRDEHRRCKLPRFESKKFATSKDVTHDTPGFEAGALCDLQGMSTMVSAVEILSRIELEETYFRVWKAIENLQLFESDQRENLKLLCKKNGILRKKIGLLQRKILSVSQFPSPVKNKLVNEHDIREKFKKPLKNSYLEGQPNLRFSVTEIWNKVKGNFEEVLQGSSLPADLGTQLRVREAFKFSNSISPHKVWLGNEVESNSDVVRLECETLEEGIEVKTTETSRLLDGFDVTCEEHMNNPSEAALGIKNAILIVTIVKDKNQDSLHDVIEVPATDTIRSCIERYAIKNSLTPDVKEKLISLLEQVEEEAEKFPVNIELDMSQFNG